MGKLSNLAVTVLLSFLGNVLQKSVNSLWDELWEYIFEAVVEAEEKWGRDNGSKKKDYAMGLILSWLDENASLNWLQRTAARLIISNLLDGLIGEFNEVMGNDWLEKAKEMRDSLAGRIPFID